MTRNSRTNPLTRNHQMGHTYLMTTTEISKTLRSLAVEHRMRGNHHYGRALQSQSSVKWIESMGIDAMMSTIEAARRSL
ncbi:hypothetical protein PBI_DYNAMIX_88 [Mycobacterium phage Dynamix]|nr:hypothetical protein PBI_DYNAMIX_88 [Mycobacterium phage Dynamix]